MASVLDKSARCMAGKLSSEAYHDSLWAELTRSDPEIQKLIASEYQRLQDTIQLLAAENQCSRAVLAALGSIVQNKTSEGFPLARLHGGSHVMDEVEDAARRRARQVFGAKYANVQPHSGTTANQIVITALLEPGDRILSMATSHGGHFSHGSMGSITSKFFRIESYYVDRGSFLLDCDQIEKQAHNFKPKLIICGAMHIRGPSILPGSGKSPTRPGAAACRYLAHLGTDNRRRSPLADRLRTYHDHQHIQARRPKRRVDFDGQGL